MTLWIVLTIMTALAAVAAAAPFLRRIDEPKPRHSEDAKVYRDQLKEIEREQAAGLVDAPAAEEARREIARRLIIAEREAPMPAGKKAHGDRSFAAIGVASVVAIGSTILYANIGSPDVPSQSQHDRMPRAAVESGTQPGAAGDGAGDAGDGAATEQLSSERQAAGTVADMIDKLAQKLKDNPKNPEGWRMLGWSYFSQDRYEDAAAAYANAIEQSPAIGALKTARGEALVRAANGSVTDESAGLFEQAIKQDTKDSRARFFLGLKKEQAGAKAAALDDWISILNGATASEPWVEDLTQRVTSLAGELKVDLSNRLNAKPAPGAARGGVLDLIQTAPGAPAPPVASPSTEKGPSAEAVKKAEAMSDADRTAMIRGMVDGLEARLDKAPRDADAWIKLIRSRNVLGETDAAKASLDKALAAFSDAPEEKGRIAAAAKELGITN